MRHHPLRRHEKIQNPGAWGVSRHASEDFVLAQIMQPDDYDHERVSITPEEALEFSASLVDLALRRIEFGRNMQYHLGSVSIWRDGEYVIVKLHSGVHKCAAKAKLTDYDALEFANALSSQSLDLLASPRLSAAGL